MRAETGAGFHISPLQLFHMVGQLQKCHSCLQDHEEGLLSIYSLLFLVVLKTLTKKDLVQNYKMFVCTYLFTYILSVEGLEDDDDEDVRKV